MKRRDFVRSAVTAGAAGGVASSEVSADAAGSAAASLPRLGPKAVVRGKKAVASEPASDRHRDHAGGDARGGNAVDAGVAGCLVQATVQQDMTNHTGTVTFLFWDAATGRAHQLNSSGTLVVRLPPFRPFPRTSACSSRSAPAPCACIPGFMPGMKAIHERFGTKPWAALVRAGDPLGGRGPPRQLVRVRRAHEDAARATSTSPSGRKLFTPERLPASGGRPLGRSRSWRRRCGAWPRKAPTYFINGEWARQFVAEANQLGWLIKLEASLGQMPPRWGEPLRYHPPRLRGAAAGAARAPGRVLRAGARHPARARHARASATTPKSAEGLYYMAHALRWARSSRCGYLHDPEDLRACRRRPVALRELSPHLADILQREPAQGRPHQARPAHVGQARAGRGGASERAAPASPPPRQLRAQRRRRSRATGCR